MRTLPTRRPPRVTQREDNGTDTPLDFVRRSPHYQWFDYGFWIAVLGSLTGMALYGAYALVGWVRGLR